MYEQYAHTIANEVRFLGHDMDDKGSDTNAFAEFILSRCAKSDFVETLDEIGVQDRLGRRAQGDNPAILPGFLSVPTIIAVQSSAFDCLPPGILCEERFSSG